MFTYLKQCTFKFKFISVIINWAIDNTQESSYLILLQVGTTIGNFKVNNTPNSRVRTFNDCFMNPKNMGKTVLNTGTGSVTLYKSLRLHIKIRR